MLVKLKTQQILNNTFDLQVCNNWFKDEHISRLATALRYEQGEFHEKLEAEYVENGRFMEISLIESQTRYIGGEYEIVNL
jgi:hypothetical protein